MWDGVFGEPVCFLLSRGGGTIVQRGEGASFGPRERGLTTMDRWMGVCHMKRILMVLSLCLTDIQTSLLCPNLIAKPL